MTNVSRTRLYIIWNGMIARCYRKTSSSYHNYGGRNIRVCSEWQTFPPFRAWALANGYTEALTLERTDNDADYNESNCTWITAAQQMRNKRTNVRIAAWGETKSAIEWSEDPRCQVSHAALLKRIAIGVEPERALSLPNGATVRMRSKTADKPYMGVCWHKAACKWQAASQNLWLGLHDTAEAAAQAYDAHVRSVWGPYAVCNFPVA